MAGRNLPPGVSGQERYFEEPDIVVASDGGEILDEDGESGSDTPRILDADGCLVCGAPVDPGYYVELEAPETDERHAGQVCETHARALDGLLAELKRHTPTADAGGQQ